MWNTEVQWFTPELLRLLGVLVLIPFVNFYSMFCVGSVFTFITGKVFENFVMKMISWCSCWCHWCSDIWQWRRGQWSTECGRSGWRHWESYPGCLLTSSSKAVFLLPSLLLLRFYSVKVLDLTFLTHSPSITEQYFSVCSEYFPGNIKVPSRYVLCILLLVLSLYFPSSFLVLVWYFQLTFSVKLQYFPGTFTLLSCYFPIMLLVF